MRTGLIALMDRTEVVDYLNNKISSFAANMVDNFPYQFEVKETGYDDQILVQDLKHILTPQIVREMECKVPTLLLEKDTIYYTGILINDIQ